MILLPLLLLTALGAALLAPFLDPSSARADASSAFQDLASLAHGSIIQSSGGLRSRAPCTRKNP